MALSRTSEGAAQSREDECNKTSPMSKQQLAHSTYLLRVFMSRTAGEEDRLRLLRRQSALHIISKPDGEYASEFGCPVNHCW